jgi:acyl dehydratase
MNATALREHRFELVEIGEEFGPLEILVDEARVKAFAFAQDDYRPWHFGPSPFGGPVAHASLFANELMQIYFEQFRIDVHEHSDPGGAWLEEAHVEETLRFEAPLPVGQTATLRGRFVEKYVVAGRGAVVLEGEAVGPDGKVVLSHRAIEYFRMDGPQPEDGKREPPLRRVEPTADGGPPADSAGRSLAAGTPIPTLRKRVTFPQLLVYSTLDHPAARRSVHTDYEIAARAGLSAPLVQGQQLICHLAEAMTGFFGERWFTGGEIRAKFLGVVVAGETVEVGGGVRGLASGGSEERLEVDAWVLRDGAPVAVANASCPV